MVNKILKIGKIANIESPVIDKSTLFFGNYTIIGMYCDSMFVACSTNPSVEQEPE